MISIPGECVHGIGPHFKNLAQRLLNLKKKETPSCLPRVPLLLVLKKLAKVIHYVEGRYYSFSMYIYGKALKGEFFLE
jgi:hypothetical protein